MQVEICCAAPKVGILISYGTSTFTGLKCIASDCLRTNTRLMYLGTHRQPDSSQMLQRKFTSC